MKLVEISFKDESTASTYSDESDRLSIGYVWQEDNTHIWIKPFKRDFNNKSYVGSPVRYVKQLINIREVV